MNYTVLALLTGVTLLSAGGIDPYLQGLYDEVKRETPSFNGFDAGRGKEIYFSMQIGKRGKRVSCASCHTNDLSGSGENVFTGKQIKPLSPRVNAKRFTKIKKVKKWLRRNFKDVYKREGTSREKGDVLTYMMQS